MRKEELQALNNWLISIKSDKEFKIVKADGRYRKRFRLVKGYVHLTDPLTYSQMNEFLRGYTFAMRGEFKGLYNL